MMALSSPRLSLFVLAMAPVIFLLLALLGPMVRVRGKALQDKIGAVGAQLAESLSAMREIQSFTRETAQANMFQSVNNEAIAAAWRYVKRRGLMSALVILVIFSSVASLLWFGGHQVIAGDLTGGQLTAFVFYALLVAGSAGTLSEIFGDLQRASGALERIDHVLRTRPDIVAPTNAKSVPQTPKQISFDDVSFAYASRPEIKAMDRIKLTLDTGKTTALVGPSGAGKSTFFDLLLRFYDPQQGAVRLDGTDITEFSPHEYRRLFALVPQDPTLFSMSIADNIRFGTECSIEDIKRAARDAGADDFIAALPDGYDTILGERGTRLSGGQAQRLALARALLRDPFILLLDEATAHLDSSTEALVQQKLQQTRKGRTSFVIAHRLSTVQNADLILVLEQGKLAAQGTHQELLNNSVLYQQLVRSQLKE
jgi:ATP-binding cassette subfamily B protein